MKCINCSNKGKFNTTFYVDHLGPFYLCDTCTFYIYDILCSALDIDISSSISFNFVQETT